MPASRQHHTLAAQNHGMAGTRDLQFRAAAVVNPHLFDRESLIEFHADLVKVAPKAMKQAQAGDGRRRS